MTATDPLCAPHLKGAEKGLIRGSRDAHHADLQRERARIVYRRPLIEKFRDACLATSPASIAVCHESYALCVRRIAMTCGRLSREHWSRCVGEGRGNVSCIQYDKSPLAGTCWVFLFRQKNIYRTRQSSIYVWL